MKAGDRIGIYAFGLYTDTGENGSCTGEYEDRVNNAIAAMRYIIAVWQQVFFTKGTEEVQNE